MALLGTLKYRIIAPPPPPDYDFLKNFPPHIQEKSRALKSLWHTDMDVHGCFCICYIYFTDLSIQRGHECLL